MSPVRASVQRDEAEVIFFKARVVNQAVDSPLIRGIVEASAFPPLLRNFALTSLGQLKVAGEVLCSLILNAEQRVHRHFDKVVIPAQAFRSVVLALACL